MVTSDDPGADRGFADLISHYERWRRIYSYADKPTWDEPAWENGRLNLRHGYPYPDWRGYVIESNDSGFNVLRVSTERRNDPHEGIVGFFSRLEDAGKYLLFNIGENLRIEIRLDPIEWSWPDGLDPRVGQTPLGKYVSKYHLSSEPDSYFVLQVGGIQPENRLLPMTYDELDSALLEGMPESIMSRL